MTTYFALLLRGTHRDAPDGLARRRVTPDGVHDEALHADRAWHRTTVIVEWERGESADELIEISEAEAGHQADRLARLWPQPG